MTAPSDKLTCPDSTRKKGRDASTHQVYDNRRIFESFPRRQSVDDQDHRNGLVEDSRDKEDSTMTKKKNKQKNSLLS